MTLNVIEMSNFLNHYLFMRYRKGFNDGHTLGSDEGYETGYDEGFKEGVRLKVTGQVIAVNTFERVL